MNTLFSSVPAAKIKADPELEAAKRREAARLTRQHIETLHTTAKKADSGITESLFEGIPHTNTKGQTELF